MRATLATHGAQQSNAIVYMSARMQSQSTGRNTDRPECGKSSNAGLERRVSAGGEERRETRESEPETRHRGSDIRDGKPLGADGLVFLGRIAPNGRRGLTLHTRTSRHSEELLSAAAPLRSAANRAS